ncbi:MAG: hypothetical protein MUO73_02230, partial [Thermoplasmata archaeon]|nr:hypothetical protein [Thermoplasmata archaeon]
MKPVSILILCLLVIFFLPTVSTALPYFTGYDIPGSNWYANLTSPPGVETGSIGDFYLDNVTGNVYQKNNTGWHWKMNVSGAAGTPGAAATADDNWTFTLPEGDLANVTNVGTTSAALFDFFIPVGATGAPGIPGPSNDAWYLWVNGTRAMAGNLSMGGYNISNVLDPVAAQDAVTLNYA